MYYIVISKYSIRILIIKLSGGKMEDCKNGDVEVYQFPQCMKYVRYYSAFCNVFNLGEKREKIKTIKDGIVIEIRNKEKGHNVPHIYAHYQGENISISLIDGSVLDGNIPKKNQKIAVEWVINNLDMLRITWENKHGIIKFPDMNTKIPSDWNS